ncbi:MAG: GIY-YIG nuclease family protein [Deltaproteobacteria bacterium]|nr:GIY-YIG nuclease family protein [Deltaproteobacteria bacterium]
MHQKKPKSLGKHKTSGYSNMAKKRKPTKLERIYSECGLRYDAREARKYLIGMWDGVTKKTSKREVNLALREYHAFHEDLMVEAPVYLYSLYGYSQQLYRTKESCSEWTKGDTISLCFPSRCVYNICKGTYDDDDLVGGNMRLTEKWMRLGPGSCKKNTITQVSCRQLRGKDKRETLKTMELWNCTLNLPYKEFNGFKDSGKMMCVPEVILHHLKLTGRNKKKTINEIIVALEDEVDEDDGQPLTSTYYYKEAEDGEAEVLEAPPDFGKRGYTAEQIVRVLERYGCPGRLLDHQKKTFLRAEPDHVDHKLLSFCAIVCDNHLYYCDDRKFCASIAQKDRFGKGLNTGYFDGMFDQTMFEKKVKEKVDKTKYEVVETDDLKEKYIELFKEDKTLKLVKTKNGKIERICVSETEALLANRDKEAMQQILGDKFSKNDNLVTLAQDEFKKFFPSHVKSKFTKDVQDVLTKHGQIWGGFEAPQLKEQQEYDHHKMRTACWMHNEIGPYAVFAYHNKIEEYDGKPLKLGWYYIVLNDGDEDFFMRGNGWFSNQYIRIGQKEGFNPTIKYQLLCDDSLPADHFKKFVEIIVKKYPDHYKKLINYQIGCLGKTRTETRHGYVEPIYDMAISAWWDNTEEKIGFIEGGENVDQKLWRHMKGKLCHLQELKIDDERTHYIVEMTNFKTLYENDVPIYNKVLENEYLRVYRLKKALGGRLIKIKTDAVIVEGGNKIPHLISKECVIGRVKPPAVVTVDAEKWTEIKINTEVLNLDTGKQWNISKEPLVTVPNGSYLVTGLAGFGKSYFVKQQPEYKLDTTIRLAFTNVASENLSEADIESYTINSCFGIDFTTGKASEKKLKQLSWIKCIMITEVFMIPSDIMGFLMKIKDTHPHIKFICEGDPEQTRPVKQEHINWLESDILYKLCDGNQIKLTVNKRNNETDNYYRILNGDEMEEKHIFREPRRVNICRTNAMRRTLNDELMNKQGYFVRMGKNAASQDMWLDIDTPIMGVKNNKKKDKKNGKMYKLEKIEKDKLRVAGIDEAFTDDEFGEYFVVAFAFTNHKVQGITIKEPFNIYEWDKMTKRERYTAYSRTSDGNVAIIDGKQVNPKFWTPYYIYKWQSKVCNDVYVGHTTNLEKRKREHLDDCKTKSNALYKKMRETGVENWEMVTVCQFFAHNRLEAEETEQEYMDELNANLNMCKAFKFV